MIAQALLVTLELAMLMKVDLTDEDISPTGVGAMMLATIVLLPAGVISWEATHGRIGANTANSLNLGWIFFVQKSC